MGSLAERRPGALGSLVMPSSREGKVGVCLLHLAEWAGHVQYLHLLDLQLAVSLPS